MGFEKLLLEPQTRMGLDQKGILNTRGTGLYRPSTTNRKESIRRSPGFEAGELSNSPAERAQLPEHPEGVVHGHPESPLRGFD